MKPKSKILSMPKGGVDPHISVRKISNGWIISKSWQTKKGEYRSEDTYSPTEPKIEVS
jgi:hypothetical protein